MNKDKQCIISKNCFNCFLPDCIPIYGCIKCNSTNIIKYGHNKVGNQNWLCKDCNTKFTSGNHLPYKQYDKDLVKESEQLIKSGLSLIKVRNILREESPKLSDSTIYRWNRKIFNAKRLTNIYQE